MTTPSGNYIVVKQSAGYGKQPVGWKVIDGDGNRVGFYYELSNAQGAANDLERAWQRGYAARAAGCSVSGIRFALRTGTTVRGHKIEREKP